MNPNLNPLEAAKRTLNDNGGSLSNESEVKKVELLSRYDLKPEAIEILKESEFDILENNPIGDRTTADYLQGINKNHIITQEYYFTGEDGGSTKIGDWAYTEKVLKSIPLEANKEDCDLISIQLKDLGFVINPDNKYKTEYTAEAIMERGKSLGFEPVPNEAVLSFFSRAGSVQMEESTRKFSRIMGEDPEVQSMTGLMNEPLIDSEGILRRLGVRHITKAKNEREYHIGKGEDRVLAILEDVNWDGKVNAHYCPNVVFRLPNKK